MNLRTFSLASILSLASAVSMSAQVAASFTHDIGSTISFDGTGSFAFPEGATTYDLTFDLGSPLSGYHGKIGGTFAIGLVSFPFPGAQTAPVTGPGTFTLYDSDGSSSLTWSLDWASAFSLGTADGLNFTGSLNLTGPSLGGDANALLSALATNTAASSTLSFGFNPGKSLTTLKTAPASAPYTGTFTAAIPEPSTYAAAMGALVLLIVGYRRFRQGRTA